jgi:hypothetical protein
MKTTMSIFAETLISNLDYKSARITGDVVGVSNYRNWLATVKSALVPAYQVAEYRWNNMGNTEVVIPCDQSALYNAIRGIIALIGDVNGDTLNPVNVAESIITMATRIRSIDTSAEMAHARCEKKLAKARLDEEDTEENQSAYDNWVAECKRLESLPGNCKRRLEMQTESAFVKNVEYALASAIAHQCARPTEDILAEKAAKKAERDAKRKANKLAKKSAK